MKEKVTIEDIAAKVGRSKSLVSLALANKYGVSEAVRSRIVMEAIRMGYKFKHDVPAKSDSKSSRRKRIFVCFQRSLLYDENYWMEVVAYVEQHLQRHGCFMQIYSWDRNSETEELPYVFYRSSCDGIIGFGSEISTQHLEELRDIGKPLVFVDSGKMVPGITNIKACNYMGTYQMARYLYRLGHKHLCFVGDVSAEETFAERRNGAVRYAETTGAITMDLVDGPIEPGLAEWVNLTQLREYLRRPDRATALMCINDAVAIRVYQVAEEEGISIPSDLSVVGFDNIQRCEWMKPALTTCAVDRSRMAEMAVVMLMKQINESDSELYKGIKVEIPTEIVERASVKKLTQTSGES